MDDQKDASKQGGIAELDADEDVTLKDVDVEVAMDADVHGRLVESQVKLMTEIVTGAATTISAAQVPKASAPRRRKGVVIQDLEETATASVIMHFEVKSKDKGKRILIEEPKPLKRQAQIEQDEAFARQLEAELNANINWNDVVDQNMAGFKMDFFRGMTYNEIIPIFEKHYNLNQAFLERVEEEVTGQKEEGSKRKVNDDDDVYTEATPLALKVPVVDYQIHHENNKPFYKIIRADGTHKLFLSTHNYSDVYASGKEIPFDTFYFGTNVEQSLELMLLKTSRKYAKGLLLLVEDLMLLVQVKAIR
nr:hypothetical protein [Tanacetum cinerariifolium]